jgi:ubiquinone/menaquinone biosynthesis C-methylase UbiE
LSRVEHRVVAAIYDGFMWPQEVLFLRRQRARAAGAATGIVLELGVGTGLNLPYYAHAAEVVGVDPDPHMLKRAGRRAAAAPCPVRLIAASAESLPFGDAEFDTVVLTLGLCTIPDPDAAIKEARRVLSPTAASASSSTSALPRDGSHGSRTSQRRPGSASPVAATGTDAA